MRIEATNPLSCDMCNCLLFMNSHAILTTSSSLNERCVEDGAEVEAALPVAVAEVAAAAVAILSRLLPPEEMTKW